jgi:hypothetical protein
VCDCDRYLEHLGNASVQRSMVVASSDIHNQFGVLLMRRGAPLGNFACTRMQGHRLNQPVDNALQMRKPLDAQTLAEAMLGLLDAAPDTAAIERDFPASAQILALCRTLPAVLLQKLSVLQHAIPGVFHRSLFCAWFGMLICRDGGNSEDEIALIFQAGLLHDLGLLHIDPGLTGKKHGISAAQWHTIRSHVDIGATIASSEPELPQRLAAIIREHHERGDGSGYPAGLELADIDPLASILGLADMIHALRYEDPSSFSVTLADCMPFLRVNRGTVANTTFLCASRILLASRADAESATAQSLPRLSRRALLEANQSLMRLRQRFSERQLLLETLVEQHQTHGVQALVQQIEWIARSSGIGSQALETWLQHEPDADLPARGIRDIEATIRELFWLVRRLGTLARALEPELVEVNARNAIADIARAVTSELTLMWRQLDLPPQPGVTAGANPLPLARIDPPAQAH